MMTRKYDPSFHKNIVDNIRAQYKKVYLFDPEFLTDETIFKIWEANSGAPTGTVQDEWTLEDIAAI